MVKVGQYNELVIVERTPFGVYLNAGNQRLIFADNTIVSKDKDIGEKVRVFVYEASDGELKAANDEVLAGVDQFARLTVKEVNQVGAFLDWGLPKDLFVPFGEQHQKLKEGQAPVVYIYNNKADGRVMASTKIEKFLDRTEHQYSQGQPVKLLILDKSDLGVKVIVDHKYGGLIHFDDIHKTLKYGQKIDGYIKNIRPDRKLDISLEKPGLQGRDDLADRILAKLNEHDGVLTISDKSPPELISKVFGVSKKQYKAALGKLYKNKQIEIENNLVRLVKK
ncbi:CvfB family protein [Pleionea sediminis]|uniref:CvfB family protein n=1 Tax=Pleionea sediminis TaxID=2569479 RepID=UPI001186F904|nr:S1-like domain-containing RNA-binding protein [Pleionea sediminis]